MAHTGNVRRKRIALAVIVSFAVFLQWTGMRSGVLDEFEHLSWDSRVAVVAQRTTHDPRIQVIAIDQASLDYLAQHDALSWPWYRSLYIPIIKFLERSGAKGLAFDMLFTESSNSLDEDKAFADAIRSSTLPIISATSLQRSESTEPSPDVALFEERLGSEDSRRAIASRYLSLPRVATFHSATLPIAEIIEASTAIGNVTGVQDSDGIFRRVSPGALVGKIPVLSLPFALYEYTQSTTPHDEPWRTRADQNGHLIVRFSGPALTYQTTPFVNVYKSFAQLEEGKDPVIPLSHFKDSYVFLGPSAPGLKDLRQIPLDEKYPGVEFHATALDNILNNSFVQLLPPWVDLLAGSLFFTLCAVVLLFTPGLVRQAGATALLFGVYVVAAFLLAIEGYWLTMALPLTIGVLVVISGLGVQYQFEGRQHRFLRHAFRHYVSPSVIDQIVADPSHLALGGARRELTIFFSDIEKFTTISEKLDPTKLVSLLNLFLSEMATTIQQSGGTVDKYVGDAVVAFWNAPVPVPDHAVKGAHAAIECQRQLRRLQARFETEFGFPVKMRIGLHTGVVSVGNFGSRDRFNYTMIGDAANLASRLEGVNKQFGTYVLFSEDTVKLLGAEIPCRKVASVKVVGRAEPAGIFEPVVDGVSALAAELLPLFEQAMARYEQGELSKALEIFEKIPHDPVAKRYVARIRTLQSAPFSTTTWSPVWEMTEK